MFPVSPTHPYQEVLRRRADAQRLLREREFEESVKRDRLLATSYSAGMVKSSPVRKDGFYSSYQYGRTRRAALFYSPPLTPDQRTTSVTWLSDNSMPDEEPDEYFLQSVGPVTDVHVNLANTFWRPSLSFNQHVHGDPTVDFGFLWPEDEGLETLLLDACRGTSLAFATLDLCVLVLCSGPLRVFRALVELDLIDIHRDFPDGSTLLHVACATSNFEAVLYLESAGVDIEKENRRGLTALDVCSSPKIRAVLSKTSPLDLSSTNDERDSAHGDRAQEELDLFALSKSNANIVQVTWAVQNGAMDINKEMHQNGNLLVHSLTIQGLLSLGLLLWLHREQGLKVDAYNQSGLTALMVAAQAGDAVMADVLVCLLGADPNKVSVCEKRSTALHFAAEHNHADVISVLLKRGGDPGLEDWDGQLPEDVARRLLFYDCERVVESHRHRRAQLVFSLVQNDDLTSDDIKGSDLFAVNQNGDTPLLAAARVASCSSALVLLRKDESQINMQNTKTGQTALSIACQLGYENVAAILLRFGVKATISDMTQKLPLHYAVKGNHNNIVELLLNKYNSLHGLEKARRLALQPGITQQVARAAERRQAGLVTPALFECALLGDADKLFCTLEDGDDVNPVSGVGDWPAYLAALNGHLDVLRLVHQVGGALWWQHGATGNTCVHAAASGGHVDIVRFLLEQLRQRQVESRPSSVNRCLVCYTVGSSFLNVFNSENKTALMIAADKGYASIVDLLLQHDATTAVINNLGELYTCTKYEGIRVQIDACRLRDTKMTMELIPNKKGLPQLKKSWLAPFHHHLRDVDGVTPLMAACRLGRSDAVRFLLESALYNVRCDACRGVTQDAPETSLGFTDQNSDLPDTASGLQTDSCNLKQQSSSKERTRPLLQCTPSSASLLSRSFNLESSYSENVASLLDSLVQASAARSIFHSENVINHVSAVNPLDGCTCVHYAVESGDNVSLVTMLLSADSAVANVQDKSGLTPLHVACKLNRNKLVQMLVSLRCVDVNVRTLDGRLPEEMTSRRSIQRVVTQARLALPTNSCERKDSLLSPTSETPTVSKTATSIDFEKLHTRFQLIKQQNPNMEYMS